MAGQEEWKKLPKDIMGELIWKSGSKKWIDIDAQVSADTISLYPKNNGQIHVLKKISFIQISEISEVDKNLLKGFKISLKNGEVEQFRCKDSKLQGFQGVQYWVGNLRHARKFWEDKEIVKERSTLDRQRKITLDQEDPEASKRLDPSTPRVFITLWNGEMIALSVNNESTFSDVYHRLFSSGCHGTCRICKLRHQFCKLWAVDTTGTKRAVSNDEILIDLSRRGDLLFVMEHNQKLLIVHFSDISYEILPAPSTITAEEVLKLDEIASKLNDLGCFNPGLFLKVESGAELLFEKNDKPFKYRHGKLLARSKAVRVNSKKKTKREVIAELQRAAHLDFYKREKVSDALRHSLADHIERSSSAKDDGLCFIFDHFALEKKRPGRPSNMTSPHDDVDQEENPVVVKTQAYSNYECIEAWNETKILISPQSVALKNGFQPEHLGTPSSKEGDWVQGEGTTITSQSLEVTSSHESESLTEVTSSHQSQSLAEVTSSHQSQSPTEVTSSHQSQLLTEVTSSDQLPSDAQSLTEVTSSHQSQSLTEVTSSHQSQSLTEVTSSDQLPSDVQSIAEVTSSHQSQSLTEVTSSHQSQSLTEVTSFHQSQLLTEVTSSDQSPSDVQSITEVTSSHQSQSLTPRKLNPGSTALNDIPYGDTTPGKDPSPYGDAPLEKASPSGSLIRSFSEPCAFRKQRLRKHQTVSAQSTTGITRQRFLSVSEPDLHYVTCSSTLPQALTASEPDLNETNEDVKVRSVYYSEESSEDSDVSFDFPCPDPPLATTTIMTCSSGAAWDMARGVERAVNKILAVKECSIEMNRVIIDQLCPSLLSILENGFKTSRGLSLFSKRVDIWSIIENVSNSSGTAKQITSRVKSRKLSEKFPEFVRACVRKKYLGQWFELLCDEEVRERISSFYEQGAIMLDAENAKAMEQLKLFLDKLNIVELKQKYSRVTLTDDFLYSFE